MRVEGFFDSYKTIDNTRDRQTGDGEMDDAVKREKIALAELKEKVSMFLYRNFIDFERDKGVIIEQKILRPAFFLNKYGIIIECFQLADEQNQEFVEKASTYLGDEVKFAAVDLRHLASKTVDQALHDQLVQLGCAL